MNRPSRSQKGRADLLRALNADPRDEARNEIAGLLGFDEQARLETEASPAIGLPGNIPITPSVVARPLMPVPFLVPMRYTSIARSSDVDIGPEVSAPSYRLWRERPNADPDTYALSTWTRIDRLLTRALGEARPGGRHDVRTMVRNVARGEMLKHIPTLPKPAWPDQLRIIIDRSPHLRPFLREQERFIDQVRLVSPRTRIEAVHFEAASEAFRLIRSRFSRFVEPHDTAGPVILLSDLGAFDHRSSAGGIWRDLGQRFGRQVGLCLSLAEPGAIAPELRRLWKIVPWEDRRGRKALSDSARREATQRLKRLLAPAIRIEPGLMRLIRERMLPVSDASVEMRIWSDPVMEVTHSSAGAYRLEGRTRLLEAFAREEQEEDQREVLDLIKSWRKFSDAAIWFEEIVSLPEPLRALVSDQDLADARAYFRDLLRAHDAGSLDAGHSEWLMRLSRRVERLSGPWTLPELTDLVLQIRPDPDYNPNVDASILKTSAGIDMVSITQSGDRLAISPGGRTQTSGLAILPTENGVVTRVPSGPPWAIASGEDRYGAWAEIEISGMRQRLRWIPEGSFRMGSPESEAGRWDDEGPQIDVIFRDGFWLFDTAVRQKLWEAVMGENPSHFKGEDRPVENVSWNDTVRFIDRVNAETPGLDLGLPSEAAWEYAGRAGSERPFVDADIADPSRIWFEKGEDVGTSAVNALAPNPWGLHQMLGNVLEWCADAWHPSHEGASPGGLTRQSSQQDAEGASRVVRGGSWSDNARLVRAASRVRVHPENRHDVLGFRCASGQARGSAERLGADVRLPGGAGTGASGGAAAWGERSSESVRVLAEGEPKFLAAPEAAFVLRTDRAELTFARRTNQDLDWATAVGRDRCGLWADLEVEDVRQRLRWIQPGAFLMGSPETEPGRFEDEGPVVEVTIEHGYWLFDTPVTQALWKAVMQTDPSRFKDQDRPVESVSWSEAGDFINVLNTRMQSRDGLQFSLPSEAAWEYACRAGTNGPVWTGDLTIDADGHAPDLDRLAWYRANSHRDLDIKDGYALDDKVPDRMYATRKVGKLQKNPWGLFDMLGNVWEWCADDWHPSHEGASPEGLTRQPSQQDAEGASRVVRGGSWVHNARNVRAAFRFRFLPEYRHYFLGFRCARGQAGPVGRSPGLAGLDGAAEPPSGSGQSATSKKRINKRGSDGLS